MPQIAACPDCGSKLKVPDANLGKKVRCPRCSTTFVVAPPPEDDDRGAVAQEPIARKRRPPTPVPEDDPDDRPRRRRRDEDDEDDRPRRRKSRGATGEWGKVRLGLLFAILGFSMYAVGWLVLGCAGASIFAGVASAMNQQRLPGQPPDLSGPFAGFAGFAILAILSAIITFVGRALEITSFVFCLYAPSKYGAKGLAIATLVLAGLGLLVSCGGLIPMGGSAAANAANQGFGPGNPGFPNQPGFPPPPPPRNPTPPMLTGNPVGSFSPIFYFAQVIVFLFFCRALALTCREEGLARSIVGLIILMGITVVLSCLSICGMFAAAIGITASAASQAARNQQAGGPPDMSNLFAGMGALGIVGIILMVLLAVMFLAALIWYFVTLFQVRTAVANHAEGRG